LDFTAVCDQATTQSPTFPDGGPGANPQKPDRENLHILSPSLIIPHKKRDETFLLDHEAPGGEVGQLRNLFTSRLATTDPRVWNGRWIDHGIGCGSGDGRACQNCGKKTGQCQGRHDVVLDAGHPGFIMPSSKRVLVCRVIEDA
jgi:hypothetical protein